MSDVIPLQAGERPALRIEHDALGRAVKVFVGPMDITRLCKRVNSVHTINGTEHEVVLFAHAPNTRRVPVAQEPSV